MKSPIADLAMECGCSSSEIRDIDNQWHNLTVIKWQNISSTVDFWIEVYSYKDSAGSNPFKELVYFVISILSLPVAAGEFWHWWFTELIKLKI